MCVGFVLLYLLIFYKETKKHATSFQATGKQIGSAPSL